MQANPERLTIAGHSFHRAPPVAPFLADLIVRSSQIRWLHLALGGRVSALPAMASPLARNLRKALLWWAKSRTPPQSADLTSAARSLGCCCGAKPSARRRAAPHHQGALRPQAQAAVESAAAEQLCDRLSCKPKCPLWKVRAWPPGPTGTKFEDS